MKLKYYFPFINCFLIFHKDKQQSKDMDHSPLRSIHIDKCSLIKTKKENILNYYKFDVKELGRGAYGVVYKAWKKNDSQHKAYAIKKLNKSTIKNPEALGNQMKILKTLDHPGIVKLHQIYEDPMCLYLVTDLCEGGELFDTIIERGSFTEKDAKRIFIQIIEAVKYCHQNKIAHRDLKPQNFMFLNKQTLELNLIDFGLSFEWEKSMREQLSKKHQTKLIGTSYYIAPEVIKGSYDERCDIWSAGVILYILLTGLPPFDGETDHDIIAQVAKGVYNMDIPEMENVSNLAKELIVNILKPDDTRLTLDQIFNHPWVYGDKEKSNDLKLDFQRMQSYAKYSKFKKIITNYLVVELTEIEVSELGNLFKKIDINHDGFVDIPELKIALDSQKECKTYAEISKMIKHIDASGKLNYNQFLASTIEEGKIFKEQNLLRLFRKLDIDGNGKVDREELVQALANSELPWMTLQEVDELMAALDKNHDGVIDQGEFMTCIKL